MPGSGGHWSRRSIEPKSSADKDKLVESMKALAAEDPTCRFREDPETGTKKRHLIDYRYDLGDCMFCQLCTNACNFDAIEFTNDFENATFDRDALVLHLDKEVYDGGSLPSLIDGGAPLTIGKFNTKTK